MYRKGNLVIFLCDMLLIYHFCTYHLHLSIIIESHNDNSRIYTLFFEKPSVSKDMHERSLPLSKRRVLINFIIYIHYLKQ